MSHFGQYNVEGLKNVRLDNKGINILGSAGAKARSIFDGEVSAVFSMGGVTGVMVRHGSYISVYCNLSSVSVHRGQKVSARQVLWDRTTSYSSNCARREQSSILSHGSEDNI